MAKRITSIVLAFAIMIVFAGCTRSTVYEGSLSTPSISLTIDGEEYTEEDFSDLTVYSCTVTLTNSYGTEYTNTYIGYRLCDILKNVDSSVIVTCDDGYEVKLTSDEVLDADTLVAFYCNDEVSSKEGTVWVVPCSSDDTTRYAKVATTITIE